MHIPDNYLSPQTCAVMTVVMIPAWCISIRKVRSGIYGGEESMNNAACCDGSGIAAGRRLSMLGVAAAFSFLGMMFNIPLPGGTTGHAVGGTLLALLVGPFGACISISVALLLQALLFGDGGILAFGANCFNMALVMPFVGYGVCRLLAGKKESGSGRKIAAAGIGSYVGINAAALCAAIEFGIQPMLFRDASGAAMYCPYPLSISIPAMMAGHLTVFGLAEVVYTTAVYWFLVRTAPDALWKSAEAGACGGIPQKRWNKGKGRSAWGLLAILILLTPLGLLAEGTAWGEWGADEIAEGAGYLPSGMTTGFSFEALLPDYSFGNAPEAVGYLLSAVLGAAVLVIVFKLLAAFAVPKRRGGKRS